VIIDNALIVTITRLITTLAWYLNKNDNKDPSNLEDEAQFEARSLFDTHFTSHLRNGRR
jgi:hypothetical protein